MGLAKQIQLLRQHERRDDVAHLTVDHKLDGLVERRLGDAVVVLEADGLAVPVATDDEQVQCLLPAYAPNGGILAVACTPRSCLPTRFRAVPSATNVSGACVPSVRTV